MEGNEMSVAFENQTFYRRTGLGGGRMGCTLVTGFLGSGKATLLRHLLDHRADLRLAVLVNELAASDVDSLLLDSARVNSAFNLSTVSLTHGCACCDVRGPFRESLQRIVDSKHNFDCLLVESRILRIISRTSGLLRAKGLICFSEDRGSRFVFQWSGLKRIEAVSGRPWDGAPKSCLVFIGHDNYELENIVAQMSRLVDTLVRSPADNHILNEYTRSFSEKVAADGRFKVPSLDKEPVVIFGLKGSPLRGIKESQLSGALMRVVNGKGNIFLTATTSAEEYNLQLLFDEGSDPDNAWNEIRLAASAVISMLCKNFCPCRSELAAHVH